MLIFLKLGGSLITDKSAKETRRPELIAQVADEISQALRERNDLSLLVGHGSGSFGHTVAKRFGTHIGVEGAEAWKGFAKVATVAARLNQFVLDSFDAAEIPVIRIQPSASAWSINGELSELSVRPIQIALREKLVPLIHGDVSFDAKRGGSIISTEALLAYLAPILRPDQILLAGDYEGVRDISGEIIPMITTKSFDNIKGALDGSASTDVTGGMATKVKTMLDLCQSIPGLRIRIFSGIPEGQIFDALTYNDVTAGTILST